MTRISAARIDMQGGRLDNAMLRNWQEILIGGASGTNTGSSYTADVSTGSVFNLILNSAVVTLTFANPTTTGACYFTLLLQQDTTGGRRVVWPANVAWSSDIPPTLSTTPSKYDIFTFMTINAGGTWFGAQSSATL